MVLNGSHHQCNHREEERAPKGGGLGRGNTTQEEDEGKLHLPFGREREAAPEGAEDHSTTQRRKARVTTTILLLTFLLIWFNLSYLKEVSFFKFVTLK